MITNAEPDRLPNPLCNFCFYRAQGCVGRCKKPATDIKHLKDKATLFYEGDRFTGFVEILSGTIKLTKYLADGRRFIIGFFYPGDIVGLSVDGTYSYTAEAISDVSYMVSSLDRLNEEINSSQEIANRFLNHTAKELELSREHMMLLARKSPIEKISSFLLHQARRAKTIDKNMVMLPMSRGDIADHLGLTIETVCRVLTKLKAMQVISIDHVKNVQLLKLSTLMEFSEGEDELISAA